MDAGDIPNDATAYELYIELAGIEPAIWRTVRVRSDSTTQLLMKWGDYHLHRFVIAGCEYGIAREGGVWLDNNADAVMVSQFRFREGGCKPESPFFPAYRETQYWQGVTGSRCFPSWVETFCERHN